MLQQTRVATAIPYFERFLVRYPNVRSLAEASESDLLANWAGLGYYYRARNLQKAARLVQIAGEFPNTYADIRKLPGVGDYTAAAVASISFDLPHAVVDGNVYRVLSRLLANSADIQSSIGKKHFATAAEALLNRSDPGTYNQALMELGATICTPKKPQCLLCPVAGVCRARQTGTQEQFPVKLKDKRSVEEDRTLFWIEEQGSLLMWQRAPHSRLMPGFWELPEATELQDVELGRTLGKFKHGITFHAYRFAVVEARATGDLGVCQWVRTEDLKRLPLSTVVTKARRVTVREHYQAANA